MTDDLEPVGDVVDGEEVEPDNGDSARLIRTSAHVEVQKVHEGPLPAPEDFARYDKVLPGAAERIMTLTESTVGHRQRMDDRHLNMVERLADRFLIAAVTLGLAVITAAFVIALVLVIQGEAAWGAGIAVVDLVAATIGLTRMMRPRPTQVPTDDDTDGTDS